MNAIVERFRAAESNIAALLRDAPSESFDLESDRALQVERGIVFPKAMIHAAPISIDAIERMITSSDPAAISQIVIIDRAGHHRPVYRPLLVYSCLMAFKLRYETLPRAQFGRWEEALHVWCDVLEGGLGEIAWPQTPMPARRGSTLTDAAWTALALSVAGKLFIRDAWTDLAADTFGRIVNRQTDGGAFLESTSADNPETWWYHELVTLHAAASYAVQTEDRVIASAVRRATDFYQRELQPDHATNQPWGLFAFLWNPSTAPLADTLLHSARTSQPMGGVTLMLLADALYCARLFLPPVFATDEHR